MAGLALVYLFADNIYLNLDGLEILLLITSVFTVASVQRKNHVKAEG